MQYLPQTPAWKHTRIAILTSTASTFAHPNPNMDINELLIERLRQLEEKYAAAGQNLDAYLEGLLYAEYLPYWDYIHLDVLLSLQKPRTPRTVAKGSGLPWASVA